MERKCPYCPDRFHNGIGLANHVRGHLNRVGVSYNVRHFISPEEVNAIEKKFSFQKKKKKGKDAFKCKCNLLLLMFINLMSHYSLIACHREPKACFDVSIATFSCQL